MEDEVLNFGDSIAGEIPGIAGDAVGSPATGNQRPVR